MAEAAVSYAPGTIVVGSAFTRTTTASYLALVSDVAGLYWPGQLHATETVSRSTTATYVAETTRSADV